MSRSRRSRRTGVATPVLFDALESRTLFSTINWVNEGNDGFIFFGANQNVARDIVHRAIGDWERVIVDFNYDDNGSNLNNTFELTINAASMGFGVRGSTTHTAHDDNTDRKPTAATVTLDDDGGGLGWYFDPNIGDEFQPEDGEYTQPLTLFTADVPFPGGPTGSDLYRTVLHEIGHAMGISLFTSLKLKTMAVNSGPDPIDPAQTLFTINPGGSARYTITDDGGAHTWEGDGPGGISLPEHPNDLMNDGRTVSGGKNRRQLISDTDALLLKDVYNYEIKVPSQFNTFAVNLNAATRTLTINGDLNFSTFGPTTHLPNDVLDVEAGGLVMRFELANGAVATEEVIEFFFDTIVINTKTGNDTIEINGIFPNKTVTVDGGEGNDDVVFGGEGLFTSSIQSNVTIDGGAGTNGVVFRDDNNGVNAGLWTIENGNIRRGTRTFTLSNVQNRSIFATNAFNDTFIVNNTPADTTHQLFGNGNSESFQIANGNLTSDLLGLVAIDGGGGNDFMTLRDHADAIGNDTWTFSAGTISKPGMLPISYGFLEGITVAAGVQNDYFFVNASNAPLSIDGGFGDDTFELGAGDLDNLSRVTIQGSVGDDRLIVNDAIDSGNDSYNLTTAAITKPNNPEFFQAIEINTQIGLETEHTELRANGADNAITVNSARGLEVHGNAGSDTIRIFDHVGPLPVTIDAGTGTANRLFLNEDGVGTVSAVFNANTNQVFSELHLLNGSKLTLAEGPNATLVVTQSFSQAFNNGGVGSLLDLNDNSMIIKSTAIAGNTAIIRDRLAAGYNGGAWNGTQGITSTTSRNSAVADGIGYGIPSHIGSNVFNGIPISGLDVILDHTLAGDTNLDHVVNLSDFNRLAAAFGQNPAQWVNGEFNYDAAVNLSDFNLLAGNFGGSISAPAHRAPAPRLAEALLHEEVEAAVVDRTA